jgi:UDP-2,4-diacetamido-2,4,6-trideoxy-beta-L-altropyranose hydrolase
LRIAFRCDASAKIGGGHVLRCLALAQALAERGDETFFLVGAATPSRVPMLPASGLPFAVVGHDPASAVDALRRYWPPGADAIIVDAYDIGANEERIFAKATRLVAVIDDLADRPHHCDLLIDYGVHRPQISYRKLVPDCAVLLLGPSYALIRASIAQARERSLARRPLAAPPKRIMISLGLAERTVLTRQVVGQICGFAQFETIDVVTGPETSAAFADCAKRDPRLSISVDPPDYVERLIAADLVVGAGGVSALERCCLGIPSLIVVLAENQRDNANWITAMGGAESLEPGPELGPEFAAALRRLNEPEQLLDLSRNAAALCDGQGIARLIARLEELASAAPTGRAASLRLRKAREEDGWDIWLWRNDPLSIATARTAAPVKWAGHLDWFISRLADPSCMMLIAEAGTRKAGMVRLDRIADVEAVVSIAVDAGLRGRGLGKAMLHAACAEAHSAGFAHTLKAEVRQDNMASRRIFEESDFVAAERDGAFLIYRRRSGA